MSKVLLALGLLLSPPSHALTSLFMGFGSLNIHVGIEEARTPQVKGDILYFTGFADYLESHQALFDSWANAGFRVITFDYPSQGKTVGPSLSSYSLKDLAQLGKAIEENTRVDASRPLILSGWSTGGLIVTRMLQTPDFAPISRTITGAILFAPGIYVNNIVGQWSLRYPMGEVTRESLSHEPPPPKAPEIRPKSPGSVLMFALSLKLNSLISQWKTLPTQIPVEIFLAGANDEYADSAQVLKWVQWQQRHGVYIHSHQVNFDAYHDVAGESDAYGGAEVRAQATSAALDMANHIFRPLNERK